MSPYKGKKVVYYEDPRFKSKSFLPTPGIKEIGARMKRLPSRRKKRFTYIADAGDPIQKAVDKIQSVKAEDIIAPDFLFAKQPLAANQ